MKLALLVLLAAASPALAGDLIDVGPEDADGMDGDPLDGALPFSHDDEDPIASQIVNGETTRDFVQVAALSAQYGTYDATFCSATLVSETELVTAAHCIDGMRDHTSQGATIWVVFGGNLLAGEVLFSSRLAEYGQHPDWTGNLQRGGDIAWIRMEDPNTLMRPVPLYDGGVSNLEKGELFDVVGFGVTGDNRSDGGVKRTAGLPYAGVYGTFVLTSDPVKNSCSGDSGGAVLRPVGEGHVLVGAVSFGSDATGDGTTCFTGTAGHSRVDLYRDWILENTSATTEVPESWETGLIVDGSERFGEWDEPMRPPEDSVAACSSAPASQLGGLGLVLGGLLLWGRRRSR